MNRKDDQHASTGRARRRGIRSLSNALMTVRKSRSISGQERQEQTTESSPEAPVAGMVLRASRMATTVLVGYRTVITPIGAVSAFEAAGVGLAQYGPITLAALVANVALLFSIRYPRFQKMLRSRIFFVCDIAIAVGLVGWGETLIPPHSYLLTYHDAFGFYIVGTLGIWASAYGARAGVRLYLAATAFEFFIALLNKSRFDEAGVVQFVAREGWLATGLVLPVLVVTLANKGLQLAETASLRAGRTAERVKTLRELHDTALQALGNIALKASEATIDNTDAVQEIRALALSQARDLRSALNEDNLRESQDLIGVLWSLAREFSLKGMRVEIVANYGALQCGGTSLAGLQGAVRESLTNARKHGNATHAVVFVSISGRWLEILIRDHGTGFDQKTTPKGFGLTYSIDRRLAELGGRAEIWSASGKGARVRLLVPASVISNDANATSPDNGGVRRTPNEPTGVNDLITRGLTWFAIAALWYRIGLSPLQIGGAIGVLGFSAALPFTVAMSAVLVYDFGLLVAARNGRVGWLLRSRIFFTIDVGIAAALNFWAAWALPSNTIMLPSRELFWGYMLGAVALWTGLRGTPQGGILVASGPVVLAVMAWLNHSQLTASEWTQVITEEAWLAATLVIAFVLSSAARQGVRVAVSEALRAGRAEERAKALRRLQGDVIDTLDEVATRCAAPDRDEAQLRGVRGLALAQISELRAALDQRNLVALANELQIAVSEFLTRGLRIELITGELREDPPTEVTDVLVRAVHEALSRLLATSDAAHAVIRATSFRDAVQIIIRDHGSMSCESISLYEENLRNSLAEMLVTVSGNVEVRSSRHNGTRVSISASYS
jgi:signal transduction histidine kinase